LKLIFISLPQEIVVRSIECTHHEIGRRLPPLEMVSIDGYSIKHPFEPRDMPSMKEESESSLQIKGSVPLRIVCLVIPTDGIQTELNLKGENGLGASHISVIDDVCCPCHP
jgi:hypothetical protein